MAQSWAYVCTHPYGSTYVAAHKWLHTRSSWQEPELAEAGCLSAALGSGSGFL